MDTQSGQINKTTQYHKNAILQETATTKKYFKGKNYEVSSLPLPVENNKQSTNNIVAQIQHRTKSFVISTEIVLKMTI